MRKITVRIDDVTEDMDWEKFDWAEQIFDHYGICPLLGVVPDNRDKKLHYKDNRENFINRVAECLEKGWSVAQHGTYHVYETQNGGMLGINHNSEFAGLPYEIQLEKLQKGREILCGYGIKTDIFMAPGHTYDKNTLRALKACGFSTVTDGLYKNPYWDEGHLFIPCRMTSNYRLKGIDTICLHTNLMQDEDFHKLEEFCRQHKEEIIPFAPEEFRQSRQKRNFYIIVYERMMLQKRRIKNKIAHSDRLSRYMEWTDHKNSKVKWMKRILCIPVLLFKR